MSVDDHCTSLPTSGMAQKAACKPPSLSPTVFHPAGHPVPDSSRIHLDRPRAAKLKPGRKHRSPLCPLPSRTAATITEVFPATASLQQIKPTRPNFAYATRSHFVSQAVVSPTKDPSRLSSHSESTPRTPSTTALAGQTIREDAVAATDTLWSRFGEKSAAGLAGTQSSLQEPFRRFSLYPDSSAGNDSDDDSVAVFRKQPSSGKMVQFAESCGFNFSLNI